MFEQPSVDLGGRTAGEEREVRIEVEDERELVAQNIVVPARGVAPIEAGDRLLARLAPALRELRLPSPWFYAWQAPSSLWRSMENFADGAFIRGM